MGVYILRKLTKRYIINSLDKLNLSEPIRYERYYIDEKLRIQNKKGEFQKEILDDENDNKIQNITGKDLEEHVLEKEKEIDKLYSY